MQFETNFSRTFYNLIIIISMKTINDNSNNKIKFFSSLQDYNYTIFIFHD